MQDSKSAIATLQTFVNTQQPLLDILKEAIAYIQGNYDTAIQSGDLKVATDQVATLTSQISDVQSQLDTANQTITDTQSQLDDAYNQLNDLTNQVQNATTIDDLTTLQTTLSNRLTPPTRINTTI
jgi:chromosome segregation ATPase